METGHLKHFRAAALGASLAGGLLLPCPLPALSGVRGSPTLPPGRSLGSLASALLGGSLRRKTSAHTAVGALLLHQTQTQAHPCSPDVRRPPGSLLLRLQAWKSPGHPSTSGHSPLAHVSGPKGPRRAPGLIRSPGVGGWGWEERPHARFPPGTRPVAGLPRVTEAAPAAIRSFSRPPHPPAAPPHLPAPPPATRHRIPATTHFRSA